MSPQDTTSTHSERNKNLRLMTKSFLVFTSIILHLVREARGWATLIEYEGLFSHKTNYLISVKLFLCYVKFAYAIITTCYVLLQPVLVWAGAIQSNRYMQTYDCFKAHVILRCCSCLKAQSYRQQETCRLLLRQRLDQPTIV